MIAKWAGPGTLKRAKRVKGKSDFISPGDEILQGDISDERAMQFMGEGKIVLDDTELPAEAPEGDAPEGDAPAVVVPEPATSAGPKKAASKKSTTKKAGSKK
jgi:hypothetical protein